jgi:hypothetical protein
VPIARKHLLPDPLFFRRCGEPRHPIVNPPDAKGLKVRGGSREMDMVLQAPLSLPPKLPPNFLDWAATDSIRKWPQPFEGRGLSWSKPMINYSPDG